MKQVSSSAFLFLFEEPDDELEEDEDDDPFLIADTTRGFPAMMVPFLGVPIMRIPMSPYFEKLTILCTSHLQHRLDKAGCV